jgi:glycosyltransferase involved in cell wall biosynthesis
LQRCAYVNEMKTLQQDYRLLIVSPIPVSLDDGQYQSMDLWVKDLKANLDYVSALAIIAPRSNLPLESSRPIPANINIIFEDQLSSKVDLENLVKQYDVITVGVGGPAWRLKTALRVANATRKTNRCLIASITSDRVKTTLMNAQGKSWLKRLKAKLVALSIKRTIIKLVGMSNGVVMIGEGVHKSMQLVHPNIHVETASWIHENEIISEVAFKEKISKLTLPKAIIATRLEPMKGVHLAIEALEHIKKLARTLPTLSILGKGPALEDLSAMVQANTLQNVVSFDGVRTYPDEFFAELRDFELVLLTNLNEEQPRLIFDAISQGLIPICPDSAAYQHLQLPKEILYKKGDAHSLALTWLAFCDAVTVAKMMRQLRPLAFKYTINAMHQKRSQWIADLLTATRN